MIRKEKHIEIRLRVLEQLDEMLRLLKTGDGFPRRSQSDNRPIPKQDSRARWPDSHFDSPFAIAGVRLTPARRLIGARR
jgi:hypothetical protein